MTVQHFQQAQPAVYEWLVSEAPKFDFAASLLHAVVKYGDLTPRQLEAAKRCADRSKNANSTAPAVNVEKLHECFDKALKSGLKRPKLRFDGFEASLAPSTGKNAGSVYVKNGEQYLGKVQGGKFVAAYGTDPGVIKAVASVIQDPLAAAIAYGKRSGNCSCCGRSLTVEKSVERGIGPICAERFSL